jgi:hypothetical protein
MHDPEEGRERGMRRERRGRDKRRRKWVGRGSWGRGSWGGNNWVRGRKKVNMRML